MSDVRLTENKITISAFQLSNERVKTTNSFLRLDMPINSLRILQHDLTQLQRSFSKLDLQRFDVPSLIQEATSVQFIIQQQ